MKSIHQWPEKKAQSQQGGASMIEQHLYTLGLQIGTVLTQIEVLGTDGQKLRERLRQEAEAIRASIDGVASEMARQDARNAVRMDGQDARIAALEQHIAHQAAEAAGFRRALGVGGVLLSGVSVAAGWLLSYWLGSR